MILLLNTDIASTLGTDISIPVNAVINGHEELVDVVGPVEYRVLPFPAVYVALALPVMEVAFVEPTNVVLDPLQIVTSEPAFTIGAAIPVPLTLTF